MSDNEVQMNYEQVEAMVKALEDAAKKIEGVTSKMTQAAAMIDEGLVNQKGKQWSDAVRGKVTQNLKTAQELLEEMARDVDGAKRDIQFGDKTGSRKFAD
jgi:uncharacterized protein YukE